jgi:4-hydroxy-tetrahydrodipicolinate reductase
MNIGIIGYGRMGHIIKGCAEERGHRVPVTVDPQASDASHKGLSLEILQGLDAVIEFALPEGTRENVRLCLEAQVPLVIGTTGWGDIQEEVGQMVTGAQGTVVYGSNFSIGAHLFFRTVQKAAELINPLPAYDIMMVEYHHSKKQDSPSGTALSTANYILDSLDRKTKVETARMDGRIPPEALHLASVRGGNIPGIHHVTLDSSFDSIEIKHTARSREGFALGSVIAAEWAQGKKGFRPVEDVINDLMA